MNKKPLNIADFLSKRARIAPKSPVGRTTNDLHTPTQKTPRKSARDTLADGENGTASDKGIIFSIQKRSDKSKEDDASQIKKRLEYERFLDWLSLPHDARNPKTQKEFATANNLTEDTLSLWKHRNGFWDEWRKRLRNRQRENMPTAIRALFRNVVKKGQGRDFLAFAQYVDEFNPKVQVEDVTPPLGTLPDEQREQLIDALQKSGRAVAIGIAKPLEDAFLAEKEEEDNAKNSY